MKYANLCAFLSVFCLFNPAQGQIIAPNFNGLRAYSNRNLAMGLPKFANPDLYNAYDHGGNVLGLLEREKKEFILETRYLSSEKSSSSNDRETFSGNFMLPSMYFNIPGMLGANIYYRNIGDRSSYGSQNDTTNELNMHNVGMDIAVGLKSGYAQAGLSVHGIVYGEASDNMGEGSDTLDNSERLLMAIPKLEICFGSQPHKLVRFGGKFGASGALDTLRHGAGQINERHAAIIFPSWGLHFDFGDTAILPLHINMSYNYIRDIVWGNYKDRSAADISEKTYNSVWRPKYSFDWSGLYMFENEGIRYHPALKFGFWNQGHERYIQSLNDRNNPFKTDGQCVDGDGSCGGWTEDGDVHEWGLSGVKLGLGFNINILQYVTGITEWEYNSVSIKGDMVKSSSKGYNRILIGAEGHLHNVPQWNVPEGIELQARASFSTGAENSNLRSYHPYALQYFDRYTFSERSLTDPGPNDNGKGYITPDLGKKVDWYNFNLGFGTGFLNGLLYGDVYLSFFYQDNRLLEDELNGIEVGFAFRLSV